MSVAIIMRRIIFPAALAVSAFCAASAFAQGELQGDYLRLADRLDRPQDGYCLDITGAGEWTQLHRPLIVHNCKTPRAIAADELVQWTPQNQLRFPAFNLCATAHGIFRRTIPGAPVVLNHCGAEPDQATPSVSSSRRWKNRSGEFGTLPASRRTLRPHLGRNPPLADSLAPALRKRARRIVHLGKIVQFMTFSPADAIA